MNRSLARPECLPAVNRLAWPLVLILVVADAMAAEAPEPPMERCVLADGDSQSKWHPAEAAMEPDPQHARAGRAMRLHIDVDHFAGERAYPIGWPRAYTPIAADRQDWSKWDFLDFWVFTETSREALPGTPLGLIVRSPDKANSFHRPLTELQKGQWTHFRVPVAKLPDPAHCTAVQFAIAESNYAHGDVVDFWIDDLALLRYAEPTLLAVRPQRQVIYADARTLRVEIELTGLEEGENANVDVALRRDGHTVASTTVALPPGITGIVLPIQQAEPGTCEVQASVAGASRTLTSPVRVITSPWRVEP